jgi:O-succinylbenzoate synthase
MSETLKQLWRDELELFYVSPDIKIDWVNLEFDDNYSKYSRDGLIFTGPNGSSEASPIKGYFESRYLCIRGALDSILYPPPTPLRDRTEVEVNLLVSNVRDIKNLELVDSKCIKVKVHSFDDVDLVKKVRDIVGTSLKIRIDCNGAFNVEDAKKVSDLLLSTNIEFIEQPCSTNVENAKLHKLIDVPIALDETANNEHDIDEIHSLDAGDIIVVKVQTSGGIFAAKDLIDQWGKDFVISSTMETEVGTELGFILAQSVPELKYASGLKSSPINNIISEPLYGIS